VPLTGYGHHSGFAPPYGRSGYGAFHNQRALAPHRAMTAAAAGAVMGGTRATAPSQGEAYQVINGCYYYRPPPVDAVKGATRGTAPSSSSNAVRDTKDRKVVDTAKLKRSDRGRHEVAEIAEVIVDENSQHSDGSHGSHGNMSSLSQPINDSSSSTSLSSVTDNV